MNSLVFPRIINIYDVILWRHICQLKCNKTLMLHDISQWLAICETITKQVTRSRGGLRGLETPLNEKAPKHNFFADIC